MAPDEIEALVKTEQSARAFFKKLCWKNYRRFCPRCRSYNYYRTSERKMRCKRCGYTFHDFSGRWINKCKIGFRQWILVVELFVQDLPATQISSETGISYPTTMKALEILRISIIANSTDASDWMDYVYDQSDAPNNHDSKFKRMAVFGILEKDHKIKIDILNGLTLESLLKLNPKMIGKGAICFTGSCFPYKTLLFHDFKEIIPEEIWRRGVNNPVPDMVNSDFLRFAKSKIIKHRGISKEKLPQYLKEMEFRYNNSGKEIFGRLCRYLVGFIPVR
jgi:transposase